jgi:abortive infection bacteriophage resistance protein
MELISFGTLSKFFVGLEKQHQASISKLIGVHSTLLSNWLHHLTYIRNICAHHSRLWNRTFAIKTIMPKDNFDISIRNDKIASTIFIITRLLEKSRKTQTISKSFTSEVNSLISEYKGPIELKNSMGFLQQF